MNIKQTISALCILAGVSISAGAQAVVKDSLGFAKAAATSPLSLLDGQVSGLHISSTDGGVNSIVNAYIRGLNAIHSDSQPLIVVDGAILSTGLSQNTDSFFQLGEVAYTTPLSSLGFLSAYEIESIEVIKDMSAAAIYGTKGANGVILITTRQPKNRERVVEWRSNVGLSLPGQKGEAFAPAFSHNHTVGVNGYVNKTFYNISGFFRSDKGVAKGSNGNFGGLAFNFDTKANPVLWFGLNSYISLGKQSSKNGVAYFGESSLTLSSRFPTLFPGDSVEGWMKDYDDNVEDYRTVTSAYMKVNFTPNLVLNAVLGVDFESNNRDIYYGPSTAFGVSTPGYVGAAAIHGSTLFNYNGKVDLTWHRFIADAHYVEAQVAFEADGNANKFNIISGQGFFTQDLRAKGIGLKESRAYNHKFLRQYFELGAYATIKYDYKKMAGIDGTVRLNKTPKYDDKFTVYPAVNAYVDFGKIFLEGNDVISTLKLTAGYGSAGREDYVPYELFGRYLTTDYPKVNEGVESFYDGLNRLRSNEYNVGVQLGFLDDRITAGLKYYDKSTVDRFTMYCFGQFSTSLDLWAWDSRKQVFTRSNSLANRGFELDINARIMERDNFKWTAFFGGSYNINQVTDITAKDFYGKAIASDFYTNVNVLGQAVSSLYGYKLTSSGAPEDATGDGQITEADKQILGNPMPKFLGSLGMTFSFSGFTIDVLAKGAAGFNIANLNNYVNDRDDIVLGQYGFTSRYVEKGDYFRLARLAVSYDIPLNVKWLQNLKVSLSGLNLFTITKYSGWNPDVNCFGTSALSCGIDYGSYPAARTIMLGVSANF